MVAPLSAGLLLAVGALSCFFGYRMFLRALSWVGFIIGAMGAALILSHQTDSSIGIITGAITAGLIVSGLMRLFYWLGVFLIGGALGVLIIDVLLVTVDGRDTTAGRILMLVALLIGGLIAARIQRPTIILATGFIGAAMLMYGIAVGISENADAFKNLGDINPNNLALPEGSELPLGVGGVAVGIVGVWFQTQSTGKEDEEE